MENNENIREISEEKTPLAEFEYDVKNNEEEEAFLTFQKKFVYPRNIKITVAFSVVAVLFLISIFRNPDGYLNYILTLISLMMIFMTWFNTKRIRDYLISALKPLENDKYRFTLYEDSFEIVTVETEEDKQAEDYVPIKPKIVNFDETAVSVIEKENMFVLILKKETIYVLPKRLISEDNVEIIRNKLSEKTGEEYFTQEEH